jgi:hypothetical protein
LDARPALAAEVAKMATCSRYWAALVPAWDDISKLIDRDGGGWSDDAYKLMRSVLNPLDDIGPWPTTARTMSPCSLCGCELGRQLASGSHWDCRNEWRLALDTLATNLRWGAALCRADATGHLRCLLEQDSPGEWWRPGCGRSAP